METSVSLCLGDEPHLGRLERVRVRQLDVNLRERQRDNWKVSQGVEARAVEGGGGGQGSQGGKRVGGTGLVVERGAWRRGDAELEEESHPRGYDTPRSSLACREVGGLGSGASLAGGGRRFGSMKYGGVSRV